MCRLIKMQDESSGDPTGSAALGILVLQSSSEPLVQGNMHGSGPGSGTTEESVVPFRTPPDIHTRRGGLPSLRWIEHPHVIRGPEQQHGLKWHSCFFEVELSSTPFSRSRLQISWELGGLASFPVF